MQDTLLVSFVEGKGDDTNILLVGRKHPKKETEIVNAFQGKEAKELYEKLITVANRSTGDVSD